MATSKRDKLGKKPRVGRTPDILRKSAPMRDRTKYDRKKDQFNKRRIDQC